MHGTDCLALNFGSRVNAVVNIRSNNGNAQRMGNEPMNPGK
jgi:hypothetical protein